MEILEARVKQKTDTVANWLANPLILLAGEQAFVKSDLDDVAITFKIGDGTKVFADLPYPDLTVRGKASTSTVWNSGQPSGIYLPTQAGTYNGVVVSLSVGYVVLHWDGTTLVQVIFPIDLTAYIQKTAALKILTSTPNDGTGPNTPDFRGQIGQYTDGSGNETYYICRSTSSPTTKWAVITNPYTLSLALASYPLKTQMFKNITPDGTHATIQAWVPDFQGQVAVDTTGGETFYLARSITSPTAKWEKIYTQTSLAVALAPYALLTTSTLTNYITTPNLLKILTTGTPNDSDPGNAPLYRGQIGTFTDGLGVQTFWICRSTTSPTAKWAQMAMATETAAAVVTADTAARGRVSNNSLVSQSRIVSKFDTEVYAHSSYIEFQGDFGYVVYMCNETGTAEGDPGQFIRLSFFNVITPTSRTFATVAVPGGTYGAITLDNAPLQVPNIIKKDTNTLRILFRGTVSGVNAMFYRDYTISTNTFGNVFAINCMINHSVTPVPLNQTNVYSHYNTLHPATSMPIAPDMYTDFFMTSDIRKFGDGNWYTCVSISSGLNKNTSSILAMSTDTGASWTLYWAPDPTLLPGTTGTDFKYIWEAAVSEDATSIYVHGRGASTGPAKGVWKFVVAKTDLYTQVGSLTLAYANSGQKPTVLSYPSIGIILITQSDQFVAPATSFRTGIDIVIINAGYTTYTRSFYALDFDGIHSCYLTLKNDELWLSFSTSRRRLPQIRGSVSSLQNTSEIAITKLDRRYFQ